MTCDQVVESETLDQRIFRLLYGELVEDFIDRSRVEVPDTFVPSATGFGVTDGNSLLWFLHPTGLFGLPRPRWAWGGSVRERLFRAGHHSFYSLRGYDCALDNHKQLWAIENEYNSFKEPKVHTLLAINTTPVLFTRPDKVARAIAQLCYPNPPEEAKDLRWIPITT